MAFMGNVENAIEKLKKYNQEHIIKIMENFTNEEKEALASQVLDMNFDTIKSLYDELTHPYPFPFVIGSSNSIHITNNLLLFKIILKKKLFKNIVLFWLDS